jgi:hypothetical protein
LEPLLLFERSLDPEVGGARQNAFCERQDAFHVEFFELSGVTVDPRERELLVQLLGMAVVRFDVDRAFEQECFVQAVDLLLNRLRGALALSSSSRTPAFRTFQMRSTDSLSSRM